MNLDCIHIPADRREHQYRILIPHKPPKQTTAQRSPSRLQHSFLAAVRPGYTDADHLSEPHTFFTLSGKKCPSKGLNKKTGRFSTGKKKTGAHRKLRHAPVEIKTLPIRLDQQGIGTTNV